MIMIDLDEMIKRNQGKDFTTPTTTSYAETHHIPTPHTLEEYNAVIAKIAPVETKASKTPQSRHLPKRGLLLLLVLAIAAIGSILGIGALAPGTLPGTGPGTVPTQTTLQSYYVIDQYGNKWTNLIYNGPAIGTSGIALVSATFPDNATVVLILQIGYPIRNITATVQIGPSYATLSGQAFYFQPGIPYTVTLVTTKNVQFTFTITP